MSVKQQRQWCGRFISFLAVLGVLVFAGFSAAPALARWGSPTSFGAGQVYDPTGVAVDQLTGSIYVSGLLGGSGIDKFDSSHDLLAPPSPFGSGSYHSGVAVNPTNSDVYVVDAEAQAIDTYNPDTGELLSSFSVPGSANLIEEFGTFTSVQIASDAAGNVYVPNAPNNEIQVFNSSGGAPSGGVAEKITGTGASALSAPTGVAVASSGNIWVADTGKNRIEEFKPDGTFIKEIGSPGVHAVAVDSAGDVFASIFGGPGPRVVEYDATGVQIDEFGLGILGETEFETPNSIAIGETSGHEDEVVYVADGGNEVVWAFQALPEVTTGGSSNAQQSTVTVSGHIDPAGNGPIVSCTFEYGTNPGYGQSVPCSEPSSAPYSSAMSVSAHLTGLTPETIYHYRIVAANAHGSTQGGDETLTTAGPPKIDSESSTDAIVSTATLNAQIDPYGYETTCEVQYITEASFQSSGYADASTLPCTPETLSAGFTDQSASAGLAGLQIGTTYHYRFVVTNQAGSPFTGADQTFATFGVRSFALGVFEQPVLGQNEQSSTQAGAHPYELTDTFALNTTTVPGGRPEPVDANVRDVRTELPPGMIGNPEATPKCSTFEVTHADCSGASQVGTLTIFTTGGHKTEPVPIYNLVPPAGLAAQFGARFNGYVTARIDAKVRADSDYRVTSDALYISAAEGLVSVSVTLWGVPTDPRHDKERYCPVHGEPNEVYPCGLSGVPLIPFLTNPTSCTGPLTSTLSVDAWQEPGVFTGTSSEMPGMTGCDKPGFTPSIKVVSQTTSTSTPTGLSVDLKLPQNENPEGIAEAELKNALVTLPEGLTVNPSSANGLQACSPAQIELHGPNPAACPEASKIGKVEIETPLLKQTLKGGMYLATPYDNPFDSLLAVYIAVYDPISGVVVKLPGHVEANSLTGQLRTRFDENPQLPFEHLRVELFGGPRAALVTPAACGTFMTSTDLVPWTSPEGADALPSSEFSIDQGCAGQGFAPSFSTGTTVNQAGAYSPLTLTFSRQDSEQDFQGLEETLPQGVLAKLAGVPLCGEAEANAGTCPEASRIGTATVAAGVGSDPVYVNGTVYLTGPYNGGPFGEVVEVPAIAGPFNLGTVVVRGSIRINQNTAQATVVSDPFPTMLKGIPLDVKTVNVAIERAGFAFNPTNCSALSATGTLSSAQGATAGVSSPFEAANCAALPFKPGFAVSTQGKTSKANGASLSVKVSSKGGPQTPGEEANIAKVRVTLPKQLPARLTTLQKACTEAQFNTNPAGCPAGSLVGSATAVTPVLAHPLTGPAYLVSHGGAAFPDLVFVLQGEGIVLYLDGNTNIKKGITTSTFNSVPDAPISSFETVFGEGPDSVLAANLPASAKGSMCGQALTMPTTLTAQNGAVVTQTTKIGVTGCPKSKKAKKKAKHHKQAKGKKK